MYKLNNFNLAMTNMSLHGNVKVKFEILLYCDDHIPKLILIIRP